MSKSGSDKKVANGLVAVSCAAVLAVYSAGYARTRAAAEQFDTKAAERRSAPGQSRTAPAQTELVAETPSAPSLNEPTPVREGRPTTVVRENPATSRSSPAPVDVAANVAGSASAPAPVETAVVAAPVAPVAAPTPAPAPEPVAAPAPPAPPKPKWKDGVFTGWGTSRHGDIQAEVVIEDGRILGATIIQCNTRYSCDVIDALPPQVAARQSPDVDFVSRATESADAFYYAVVEALNKAKPTP